MAKRFDVKQLNNIITELSQAMENSRTQVFRFNEVALHELSVVEKNLYEIKNEVKRTSIQCNLLKSKFEESREKFLIVTEKMRVDIHNKAPLDKLYAQIYEEAKSIQDELFKVGKLEDSLIRRRNQLERDIKQLKEYIKECEVLLFNISGASKFFDDDLRNIGEIIDKKQALIVKILEVQEAERKRVAREIHDGPAQMLASIIFSANINKKLLDIDIEKAKEDIDEFSDRIRGCLQEIREIIYNLRPMALDDLGLLPTLEEYIRKLSKRTKLDIQFKVINREFIDKLDKTIELVVFRGIQEASNNILKHSKAKAMRILLEFMGSHLNILIFDNGIGFDVDEVLKTAKESDHFGLLGLKERIELLDGNLCIKSEKNKGTRIRIKIPLDAKNTQH